MICQSFKSEFSTLLTVMASFSRGCFCPASVLTNVKMKQQSENYHQKHVPNASECRKWHLDTQNFPRSKTLTLAVSLADEYVKGKLALQFDIKI